MTKVLTVGVYDYFHLGHLRLFKQARAHGDYLIVAAQDDDYILKFKPASHVLYNFSERKELLESLRCVDEVVKYTSVDSIVKDVEFDVFAVGEDQKHDGFLRAIRWCEENGKEVVRLKRTEGISSTDIKKEL
ncbi:MAG: adenylyltransferase/cytidyltransferase family protein [Bacteroidales bacterium]|nr:adenylyltransferase/cytidyltransferase family protein [Bacteroidales bacterium]